MTHTLGIVLGPKCGVWSWVHLDGHDISNHVSRVEIDGQAGDVPQVKLTLAPHRIVFSAANKEPFDLDLADEVQIALVQAGWTPPAADE